MGETLGIWTEVDARWFGLCVAAAIGLGVAIPALRPEWIVRFPKVLLTILVGVSLLAASALYRSDPPRFHLDIDPSTEPLLPRNDPAKDLYESAVLDFGDDEVFVVAIECEEVFSVGCLSAIDRVTDRIARLDAVRSVSSLLDVTSFRWVEEEQWVEVQPFIEEVPTDPGELAELRARALADPVYRRTIVSEDSRAAAINISFRKMTDADFIASGLDAEVQEILREETGDEHRFYIAGRPHVKVHVYAGMVHDLRLLIPVGAVVMAVALLLLTGARRMVMIPILTSLVAILWTFGSMAAVGTPLTLLTGLLAPMLLAIGSVYGIHVIARYQEDAGCHGDARSAVLASLEHLVVPVLIAGMTTVIGLAALLITDVPAVFELGTYSMLGIASITVLALTGIPAALVLMPLKEHVSAAGSGQRSNASLQIGGRADAALGAALDGLAAFVVRHPGRIIIGAGVAAVISLGVLPRITIDTDYLSYFDERDPIRRDFEAVNRLLAGAIPIYVVLSANEAGAFRDPDLMHAMEALQRKLDEVPGVSRTLSAVDSLRLLNRAFAADDPKEERIPDSRPAVSELLFMMPKSDISKYTTVNHGRGNLIVRTGEVGSAAIEELAARIEQVVAESNLPDGIETGVTGNTILLAHSADGIARGQPVSVALAAIAIFVLITIGLRSVRLGAIAMIPNLLPVLMFFGLLGLGFAPLSLPTSLIGCIAMGVAIDDTVHFLVRYRKEREKGESPEQAVRTCGRYIGRPIAITSIVISLGFLVVAVSDFATLREFGYLSCATMVICFFNDLILLPALLIKTKI